MKTALCAYLPESRNNICKESKYPRPSRLIGDKNKYEDIICYYYR